MMHTRRVTCYLTPYPHPEATQCKNPIGVALVPYREPKDIQEGDVVRADDSYFHRGMVGEAKLPGAGSGTFFIVNGWCLDVAILRRLA